MYGQNGYATHGLLNSATFLVNALRNCGIEAKAVLVDDNNCIDREVTLYKPTHAIIHALWVVPSKWDVLLPLHPNVQWIIRIHSDAPFIANEGIAFEWLRQYREIMDRYKNFHISCNSYEFNHELDRVIHGLNPIYLPNIYCPSEPPPFRKKSVDSNHIDIGCFGAMRPMKNHLMQAIAAIIFAENIGKQLRFHINSSRVEQRGETVLKNLQNLFRGTKHELVEHGWYSHRDFLEIVSKLDVGMQVSFSETFNIVSADTIYASVPMVVSDEIPYVPFFLRANPATSHGMVEALALAMKWRQLSVCLSRWGLRASNRRALRIWIDFLNVSIDTRVSSNAS